MLTFLFWNLRKQNLAQNVARLVALHDVDIVILAETNSSSTGPGAILNALKVFHYSPDSECPRVQIFTKFSSDFIPIVFSRDRYTVRGLPNSAQNAPPLAAWDEWAVLSRRKNERVTFGE